jgi:hypothetical protein
MFGNLSTMHVLEKSEKVAFLGRCRCELKNNASPQIAIRAAIEAVGGNALNNITMSGRVGGFLRCFTALMHVYVWTPYDHAVHSGPLNRAFLVSSLFDRRN